MGERRDGYADRLLTGPTPWLMMYLHVDTLEQSMATKGVRMELMVSKWGNSLAVRLPAESARRIGVGEGDTLVAEGRAVGKSETRRLRQFLGRQKETAPVVGDLRGAARY
jgi:antitoxin MazE